jgi:hypothetical protein
MPFSGGALLGGTTDTLLNVRRRRAMSTEDISEFFQPNLRTDPATDSRFATNFEHG